MTHPVGAAPPPTSTTGPAPAVAAPSTSAATGPGCTGSWASTDANSPATAASGEEPLDAR